VNFNNFSNLIVLVVGCAVGGVALLCYLMVGAYSAGISYRPGHDPRFGLLVASGIGAVIAYGAWRWWSAFSEPAQKEKTRWTKPIPPEKERDKNDGPWQ
jgi:hypothetical protein